MRYLILYTLVIVLNFSTSLVNASEIWQTEPKQAGYVPVEDGELFFQKFGNNASKNESIIVLHGGPGLDQNYLLPQMLELAIDHEVIFYDQRGSGKSLKTPINLKYINLDQFTKDLEQLRIHLGLNKFILMGHSWGGLLAMNYAIKHPKVISKLILLNSAAADAVGQLAFIGEFTKRTAYIMTEIAPLFKYEDFKELNEDEIRDMYRKLFAVYFVKPQDVNELTLNMTKESAISGFKVMECMSKTSWLTGGFNLLPALSMLKVPTLILHGSQDIVPPYSVAPIQLTIPQSKIMYLKQCGHFPYIEKPTEFFNAITKFIRSN